MLHAQNSSVRELLLKGGFGLEKESLRVTREGYLAKTAHPFDDPHIVRDFCENQTEINTPVMDSAQGAIQSLLAYSRRIQRTLAALEEPELLWPLSNPPFIRDERDVPVARFYGKEAPKTAYREYLSNRYGRYKMTLCGIHINYSFADELLWADFALSGEDDFQAYKSRLYLDVAANAAFYGWIMTAVTAASPILDCSFVEKGRLGVDSFLGMASVRCSELGYWNYFTPVFDYSDLNRYADSIQAYVDTGLLAFPTELYYPIRLKPAGTYNLTTLREHGVDHIEFRMVDLNPLVESGLQEQDLTFAQLLLVWLASIPARRLTARDQVQAAQNFKNAAHYDLKTVKLAIEPGGKAVSVAEAALDVIAEMKAFYEGFPQEIQRVLAFEEAKFIDAENRYAWFIRENCTRDFVEQGLALARHNQIAALEAAKGRRTELDTGMPI